MPAKPRATKATGRKVVDSTAVETPEPTDHDLLLNELAAEGRAEPDLPEGAVIVPLHDRDDNVVARFVVLHPDDWPSSAIEDANTQRFYSWGLKVLASEEGRLLWQAIDPKMREAIRFMNDWQVSSGNRPGKEQPLNGSSPTMPAQLRAI